MKCGDCKKGKSWVCPGVAKPDDIICDKRIHKKSDRCYFERKLEERDKINGEEETG